MNDAEIRRRLAELEQQALAEHADTLEAVHAHIVAELDELRRSVPPSGRHPVGGPGT